MSVKIGINAIESKKIDIVGVNDLIDAEYIVYLLRYDTVHGKFPGTVELGEDKKSIVVNGKNIPVFCERDPANITWGKVGAYVVAECTGFFLSTEKANAHLKGGAKKVVISAPSPDAKMFVMGVNHKEYKGEDIVSNASCTTNCLAPITKLIDQKYGVVEGLMTTIHAVTSNQRTVDVCVGGGRKKWTRGRCTQNIIPTSTGAAAAVGKVYAPVNGKLTGMCFRVPMPDVSVVDLTVKLKNPVAKDKDQVKAELGKYLKEAAASDEWKGIFRVCDEPCVSMDFCHDACSCIYDEMATLVLTPTFIKFVCWYDNEWGYSMRMIDLIQHVAGYKA